MRSTKLTTAVAAAATLLALAPAAAIARIHPHVNPHHNLSGCHLTLFVEPHRVTEGEKVEAFGALLCPGGEGAGQTVTIYQHTAGTPGFVVAGTTTSGAGGAFEFPPTPPTADTVFYGVADGARSPSRAVRVAPVVTVNGAAEGTPLITGFANRQTFIGAVSPLDAGAEVVLQREQATAVEEWHTIQIGNLVQRNGTYAITHVFGVPGDANLRVVVRPHGKFTVRGLSNTLSYEISQAENRRLTINSSANPISYGNPVTISGVLAPTSAAGSGGSQKVELLGRTAGTPFTKVGEAMTESNGKYDFVIPAATANMQYRVTSAVVRSSAVLFQGVKYILEAGVSATKVQSGQPLTWSGTVTPGVNGKFVYLERENLSGGGFHVVDLAPVVASGGPGSVGTFTLTHYLFGTGNQVYRIRVPGDPTNQAVASPAVTIEVTPAPLGSLRPVKGGSLPH